MKSRGRKPLCGTGSRIVYRKALPEKSLEKQQKGTYGPKISPHCLRHSYVTHLIEGGVDRLEVPKILGHHSILTTAKYTHLTDQTEHNATTLINTLMDGFSIGWGNAK